MTTERPTPDDIEEVTHVIDEGDLPWNVDDWNFKTGLYEQSELELTVKWDPQGGEFDAEVVETGTSAEQRTRIKNVKGLVSQIETGHADGAPIQDVARAAVGDIGMSPQAVHREIEKLRTKGEVYEPKQGHLRTP